MKLPAVGVQPAHTVRKNIVGYVWREAFAGDTVCVPPQFRDECAEAFPKAGL